MIKHLHSNKMIAWISMGLLLVILFTLIIHHTFFKPLKVYPPDTYVGDGTITFIEAYSLLAAPGWMIKFDQFDLSKEFSHTYSFSGLPGVQNLKVFDPYLYTPPSTNGNEYDKSRLKMTLFADGDQESTYDALLENWHYTDPYIRDEGSGQDDKNFYCFEVSIASDPSVNYQLEVKYIPSSSIVDTRMGYFYLLMSGGL